jgi:GNAT superfamily N-acetyltransferase
MCVRIRVAALESDRTKLIDLFRRHLTPQWNDDRYDTLYLRCPHGPASAWVAHDDSTGALIGAAAAFPRKLYFDGMEREGFVLGDFCLEEKYRSLGPALMLQRACLEAVRPPYEFFYDFPSQNMMAIYKRLGIVRAGRLVRWAKPLRMDKKVDSFVRSKTVARELGAIGNIFLAHRGKKTRALNCEAELHQGLCGEEFTALDRKLQLEAGIRTARSAEYLNWRYLSQSPPIYEILTARRNGNLIGYAVVTRDTQDARIIDLSYVEERAVGAQLLTEAVERLRLRGAATVSLNAGEEHPWNELFERAGFRRRESSPLVAYARLGSALAPDVFQKDWYVMQGERDS